MEEVVIIFDEINKQSLAMVNNSVIGECTIGEKDNKWYITHTGVREEYSGRGIAKALVNKIIDIVKERHIELVPICSYAKKVLMTNLIKDGEKEDLSSMSTYNSKEKW